MELYQKIITYAAPVILWTAFAGYGSCDDILDAPLKPVIGRDYRNGGDEKDFFSEDKKSILEEFLDYVDGD